MHIVMLLTALPSEPGTHRIVASAQKKAPSAFPYFLKHMDATNVGAKGLHRCIWKHPRVLGEHEFLIDKLIPVGKTLQPQCRAIVLESLLKQNIS